MGSIRTRKGARGTTYNALWRDPNGKQRSKTFTTRQAAKAFLKPRSAVPGYRPPVPQHEGTLAAYAATWIEEHDLKPAARQTYRLELAKHILPALGRLQLAHVTSADIYTTVKKWRAAGMGPTVQAKCRTIMSALFEDAVARGILPANPARRVQIARQAAREMRILTVEEYQRVIKYLDPGPRLLVRLAVASGARWGELAELRGADLAGDTLSISRNVAELKSPHRFVVQATPKNGKARKVKIPRALAAEVRAAVTDPGKLLFPRGWRASQPGPVPPHLAPGAEGGGDQPAMPGARPAAHRDQLVAGGRNATGHRAGPGGAFVDHRHLPVHPQH